MRTADAHFFANMAEVRASLLSPSKTLAIPPTVAQTQHHRGLLRMGIHSRRNELGKAGSRRQQVEAFGRDDLGHTGGRQHRHGAPMLAQGPTDG